MPRRLNSSLSSKIILQVWREIKKFRHSISLLSNPAFRWKNREIPSYKSPCLTNNSIVICKIIVGAAIGRPLPQCDVQQADARCSPLQIRKGERYMKATGIVRRVDDLGRIVIPKEIRRTLKIREGDPSQTTLTPIDRFCIAIHSLAQRITAQ